ncbi:hypothetical protein FRB94_001115 [Tulasnella sp. JGI-2019a]|nr:hypothetical protein FRB94_001115 [Tulasnella sp. JGI-2019a]
MQKIKNVLKPNHNANDPANQDSYDTTSGGADHTTVTRGTGLGPTNVGPGAPNY